MAVLVGCAGLVACVQQPPTTPPAKTDPTMPTTGRFLTPLYSDAQLTPLLGQVYGTAVHASGQTVDLALDLYLPPTGGGAPASRPAVVLVHGGGFTSGSRADMAGTARSYARRGYVAATISYRLDPDAHDSTERYLATARNAIDDGMESVRWLRSQATALGIDTTRIAVLGSSAGGAVALGIGLAHDPTPGGPLAAWSPMVAAVASTGATLTPGIDTGLVTFEATDAPSLMFHYAVDTVTGFPAAYSKITCDQQVAAGSSCRFVQQAGNGHTVSLSADGGYFAPELAPFLWSKLALGSI
jgi:acetyl esterase/lipase